MGLVGIVGAVVFKTTRQNGRRAAAVAQLCDFYRIQRVQMPKTATYQRKVMTRWTRAAVAQLCDFYRIQRVQMPKTATYQRKVMTRWTRYERFTYRGFVSLENVEIPAISRYWTR